MDEDMDCVALTETWLSDSGKHEQTIVNLTISGYVLDHAPRVDRTGGGVALLYKKGVKCTALPSFKAKSF